MILLHHTQGFKTLLIILASFRKFLNLRNKKVFQNKCSNKSRDLFKAFFIEDLRGYENLSYKERGRKFFMKVRQLSSKT